MPNQKNLTDQKGTSAIHDAAMEEMAVVLEKLRTSPAGLSEAEAATRLDEHGPNEVAQEKQHGWLRRLWIASRNPLVILLTILAIFAFATAGDASDYVSGSVMLAMVLLALSLRLIQETKADNAAAKLKAMIKVTATALRDGGPKEIPLEATRSRRHCEALRRRHDSRRCAADCREGLVHHPGHAHGRIVAGRKNRCRETRANVSPIELHEPLRSSAPASRAARPRRYRGNGQRKRISASMASSLAGQQIETAFDNGMKRFTWLMIRFMAVMVPLVFFINGLTKGIGETLFFALAVAVGLTPEMLPMIVTVCLSKGRWRCRRRRSSSSTQCNPELRRDGRALHRQDRHTDH